MSAVKGELIKPTVGISISLVTRKSDLLMNAQSLNKWCSTLKSLRCLPRVCHCLRLLVGMMDGLLCEWLIKADLLLDHFDSNPAVQGVY